MDKIVIRVGGERFQCQRSILKGSSGYFRAMFRSQLDENSCEEISVLGPHNEEFSNTTMQIIIKFINSRNTSLTNDTALDVLFAAEYLDIESLSEQCCNFLIKTLSGTTWLKTFRTAQRLYLLQ